jgi:hypothetical protein
MRWTDRSLDADAERCGLGEHYARWHGQLSWYVHGSTLAGSWWSVSRARPRTRSGALRCFRSVTCGAPEQNGSKYRRDDSFSKADEDSRRFDHPAHPHQGIASNTIPGPEELNNLNDPKTAYLEVTFSVGAIILFIWGFCFVALGVGLAALWFFV